MHFRWLLPLRNALWKTRGTANVTRAGTKKPRMSQNIGDNKNKVFKVVLTGGPCGGKTTGQARLSTFFENLGWKVYRAQETALVLMSGGVKFSELSQEQAYSFQENLIKTMMQVENTYFDLAQSCQQNCLVICDRGLMDGSAYLPPEDWEKMKRDNGWSEVNLRDNRYNQVIHMVSAASGAEAFYTCAGHKTRSEDLGVARHLDDYTSRAWVGHPYYDVIDNSTDFEGKIARMIHAVCNRLGIDAGDRLETNTTKRKFLVKCLPSEDDFPMYESPHNEVHFAQTCAVLECSRPSSGTLSTNFCQYAWLMLAPYHNNFTLVPYSVTCSVKFPPFQDFTVIHDYLVTPSRKMQARLRKRGQHGVWTYTHTIRRPEINKQSVELRMAIHFKDYSILLMQRDENHDTINKLRRCFLWKNQYFQMDIYTEPCPDKCRDLILLETYTTKTGDQLHLPDFLNIVKEVTEDPNYSMFNLSLKDSLVGSPSRIKSLPNNVISNSHDLTNSHVVTDK